jgi:hypothetical protein
LGGALVSAALEALGQGVPASIEINVPLAKEQLKIIDQILADLDKLFRGGERSATDREVILWSRRRVDSLRASGASRAQLIAALEQYLVRTRSRENSVRLLNTQDAGISRMDALAAEYDRLEAEMLLNQEKAR